MAGAVGRRVTVTWNGTLLKGLRAKTVSYAAEPIDLTSGEDNGFTLIHSEAGERKITVALSGILKDEVIRAEWMAGNFTRAAIITYPNGATLACDFFCATYSDTGPYKEAMTFEASIQSTGVPVYTPGS